MEKTNKYRQAFGIGIGIGVTIQDGENQRVDEYENEDADDRPRRVRYRVHEDGGEADEGREDVISLPPIYDDTVRRSRPRSHPTRQAAADEEV